MQARGTTWWIDFPRMPRFGEPPLREGRKRRSSCGQMGRDDTVAAGLGGSCLQSPRPNESQHFERPVTFSDPSPMPCAGPEALNPRLSTPGPYSAGRLGNTPHVRLPRGRRPLNAHHSPTSSRLPSSFITPAIQADAPKRCGRSGGGQSGEVRRSMVFATLDFLILPVAEGAKAGRGESRRQVPERMEVGNGVPSRWIGQLSLTYSNHRQTLMARAVRSRIRCKPRMIIEQSSTRCTAAKLRSMTGSSPRDTTKT